MSLARVAYSNCEVALLDDPLSAVDAYVGKSILDDCLLSGPLASRTRVLVTHSLHVLPKMDYIYVLENGTVAEQGTYKVQIFLAAHCILSDFTFVIGTNGQRTGLLPPY